MSLRESVRNAKLSAPSPKQLKEIEESRVSLDQEAKKILDKFGLKEEVPDKQIIEEIKSKLANSDDKERWRELTNKEWTFVPYVLLSSKELKKNFPECLEYFHLAPKRAVRSLLLQFLSVIDHQQNEDIHNKTIRVLKRRKKDLSRRWQDRINTWNLLKFKRATKNISRLVFQENTLTQSFFKAGFYGPLARGTYGKAILLEFIQLKLQSWLTEKPSLAEIRNFLSCFGLKENPLYEINYPELNGEILATILLPWMDTDPEERTKEFLLELTLTWYGDPRSREWFHKALNPQIQERVLHWLIGRDIDLFIEIVRKTSSENEIAENQWQYREKFWKGLYDLKLITSSKLFLAREGRSHVKDRNLNLDLFSTLQGQGTNPNHCVLLLEISNVNTRFTVAEWNSNGACRIWNSSNSSTPKFAKTSLSPLELRNNENFRLNHANSLRYYWQSKLAKELERRLGIRSLGEFYR